MRRWRARPRLHDGLAGERDVCIKLRPMQFLALLLALTSLITNPRVAVSDGTDDGSRAHDAVVVDMKGASARFVKQGEPLLARQRSIIVELLAPPVGPLPNTSGLPAAFDRPGIEKL